MSASYQKVVRLVYKEQYVLVRGSQGPPTYSILQPSVCVDWHFVVLCILYPSADLVASPLAFHQTQANLRAVKEGNKVMESQ